MKRDGWRLVLALLAAITLLMLIRDARPGSGESASLDRLGSNPFRADSNPDGRKVTAGSLPRSPSLFPSVSSSVIHPFLDGCFRYFPSGLQRAFHERCDAQ